MPILSKKKIIVSLIFVALLAGGLLFVQNVLAQTTTGPITAADTGINQVGQTLGFPATDIRIIAANIIRVALGLLGIIALVLIIYGGFVWMTAGGNEENIAKAKKILMNATIGLIIILSAYAIVSFVINALIGATTGGGQGNVPGEGGPNQFSSVLYVWGMPGDDLGCGIRNIHPVIVFNKNVDIDSVRANLHMQKKDGGAAAGGNWNFVTSTRQNAVVFDPDGDCGVEPPQKDCLDANTTYQIVFNASGIKSQDASPLALNCHVGDYQKRCANNPSFEFTTGADVDREPPTVTIINPASNGQDFPQGLVIPVEIVYTDNFGVQNIALQADGKDVDNMTITGCKKSGTTTFGWISGGSATGTHALTAIASDNANLQGSFTRLISLRAGHCYDNVLDPGEISAGPPACGGECGNCGGSSCSADVDCASGYCEIPSGQTAGVCVDRMRIDSFSPTAGAASTTYVSLRGQFFGEDGGSVFFRNQSGWTVAHVASCGAGIDNWTNSQIIVKVPADAISGPIMVETASTSVNGTVRKWTDSTDDNWGYVNGFTVNDDLLPGLCAVVPNTASPYADVTLIGENFGPELNSTAGDKVFFGTTEAIIRNPSQDWNDRSVKARVPPLGSGLLGVKIRNDGKESNSVRFVMNDVLDSTAPMIESITPEQGATGEYITIVGRNFGPNKGEVWFKEVNLGDRATAQTGSFDFPKDCESAVWSDSRVVVKFPQDAGDYGDYTVQVQRSSDGVPSPIGAIFKYQRGQPGPGICKIDPMAGPVPFAPGNDMKIYGEYFNPENAQLPPSISDYQGSTVALPYYWTTAGASTSLDGRLPAAVVLANDNKTITAIPPTTSPTPLSTGPVAVYRGSDGKMSNDLTFTVYDCVKHNNDCSNVPDTRCCASGLDAGICKPNAELCSGETRSTGYMWRFNTGPFPPTPQVAERCDGVTEAGQALPTPSPDIRWNGNGNFDATSVCRGALVTVEFTMKMKADTVKAENIEVYKCKNEVVSTFYNVANDCERDGGPIQMSPGSYSLDNSYGSETESREFISMKPAAGQWSDDGWYQVVLKTGVMSTPTVFVYGSSTINLDAKSLRSTRPCGVANSAYCFVFKTDARKCNLRQVIVTPYSYWTAVLESPIKNRAVKDRGDDPGEDLYWRGSGLSDQKCVMMDMSEYDWSWKTGNHLYASIYGVPTGINSNTIQVSALANTVAVGLAGDSVVVRARAVKRNTSEGLIGESPLTIDLSKPRVVDYWPKCLEACTNAEVGAQFNIIMANDNHLPDAVKLYKCSDENCIGKIPAGGTKILSSFDSADRRILHIALSPQNTELELNTLYQVVISRNGTTTNDRLYQLWSGASVTDDKAASKPYQEEFTWRFRTKKEKCTINSVDVIPSLFTAYFVDDRHVYSAEPRSAPDACDPKGQRLNPWSIDWNWSSSDGQVAKISIFSTKGQNQACTPFCVKKGSTIPAGSASIEPVCGNGILEAGEDCDPPGTVLYEGKYRVGCSLNCLRTGNTLSATTTNPYCGDGRIDYSVGEECDTADPKTKDSCTSVCTHAGSQPATGAEDVNASICGNSMVGIGEDCDTAISPDRLVPGSSLYCSSNCTHSGSQLAVRWCVDNATTSAGFPEADFKAACAKAVSQCGDGITSSDEDTGCDLGNGRVNDYCTENCLANSINLFDCSPYSTSVINGKQVISRTEGCDLNGQHAGSSLMYSTPSVCGDGDIGIGEDAECETNFAISHAFTDPWTLAVGVGLGIATGTPPAQLADIKGKGNQTISSTLYSKEGSGQFKIMCGYKTDEECAAKFGAEFGVSDNTCCYRRPMLISEYPVPTPRPGISTNICPNTYIEAVFDKQINLATLKNNLLIARGYNTVTSCPAGESDVTHLVQKLAHSGQSPMAKIWSGIKRIAGWVWGLLHWDISSAQSVLLPKEKVDSLVYCVGKDTGEFSVILPADATNTDVNTTSTVVFRLKNALAMNNDYAIIFTPGVRDTAGVSVGGDVQWQFITGPEICEINGVTVEPAEKMFTQVDEAENFSAVAASANNQLIQPVSGYSWEYQWGPFSNDYVILQYATTTEQAGDGPYQPNVIKAKNRNGELDVIAKAVITENTYTGDFASYSGKSHVTVFLCENPWPPLESFPFRDEKFDFTSFYCMDNGSTGVADDLPNVTSSMIWTANDVYLKRYIFTNSDNKDAIGLQIFRNNEHLSISDWFSANGFSGKMNSLKIDGYDAISDGNNIYIDALKTPSLSSPKLYSNVYLLSINSDATAETRRVFDQLAGNLKFNPDLVNLGYCAATADPATSQLDMACNNDLDCLADMEAFKKVYPTSTINAYNCLNLKDKMQRNYQRLKDYRTIESALYNYNTRQQRAVSSTNNYYPLMNAETFLPGQALSVWANSWTKLSGDLLTALPVDPINKLVQSGTCFVNTSQQCYSDNDCAISPINNRQGYWTAEAGTKDEGTLKNDGLIEGDVGYADGKGHGKAFDFPGTSDAKLVIPAKEEYNNYTTGFSVSVWIYPTRKNTATIIKKGGSDANGKSLGGFVLEYSGFSFYGGVSRFNNGTIRAAVFPKADDPHAYYALDTNIPLELNKWHHIVARLGAAPAGEGYIYIDGVRADDNKVRTKESMIGPFTPSMATNTLDMEIGQNFNGRIDNIAYYKKFISLAEINRLYSSLCILHDPVTGWSTEDRRFSFACNTSSFAYRYFYSDLGRDYYLRGRLESDGIIDSSDSDTFVSDFTRGKVNFSTGICDSATEVSSPYNTVCGDGIIGPNEACDPPGETQYNETAADVCHATIDSRGNYTGKFSGSRCSSDCTGWQSYQENCSILGRCGDGKVQAALGEICDDGDALNGQNGRCSKQCTGIVSTCGDGVVQSGELCDTASGKQINGSAAKGWCVGGNYLFMLSQPSTRKACNEASDCDTNLCYISNDLYGQTRAGSCNWDCKSRGSYCGDGVVSTEWGEQCETDQDCSIDGQAGKQACTLCRFDNRNVGGLTNLWNFDSVDDATGFVPDLKGDRNGTCVINGKDYCPPASSGVPLNTGGTSGGRSYHFGQNGVLPNIFMVADAPAGDLINKDFTVELWVYPDAVDENMQRIVQKGAGSSNMGGFYIWYYGDAGTDHQHGFGFGLWDYRYNDEADSNYIKKTWLWGYGYHIWHHVALVFKADNPVGSRSDTWEGKYSVYINGIKKVDNIPATFSTTTYPLCMGARCKLSSGVFVPDGSPSYPFFRGKIDEFYLYNTALSDATIKFHYDSKGWYCSASSEATSEGACGNGIIEENEACDRGKPVNLNGVVCTPEPPQKSCTYCSADCRNVLTYDIVCGNGVIDAGEACDTALSPWRSITAQWGDTCNVCQSTCKGKISFANNNNSSCRNAGLGYCGDGTVNGTEECDPEVSNMGGFACDSDGNGTIDGFTACGTDCKVVCKK